MAMSQRSTGSSFRGGRGGFNLYGRQRQQQQRQLPQPRPFRPPAPVTPPPPSEETFQPKAVTEELHDDHHSPSFLLRLLLPGFMRLEEVNITKGTGSESKHVVRVQGERFDSQANKRYRFDTTFIVPLEYDISPPMDAKLESGGILTITFPKFSSSSSSSSSWNSSESQTQSQSSSDEESPLRPYSPPKTDDKHEGGGNKSVSGKNVSGKEKAAVDQERGEMTTQYSPASHQGLSPASDLIKRTRDSLLRDETMGRGRGGHDGGKGTTKVDAENKLADQLAHNKRGENEGDNEIKKESSPSVGGRDDGDHGGGSKSTSGQKVAEKEKEVDRERGERAGQMQLMANMGVAVAVIVTLGAFNYYFTFA
ncbi:unnamed protein product [Linum tenue]|uniref:SHSP domain-containing protein n=1 Tax=Linum tenue TaxID=586396 RepID=A0AAV0M8J1_9ROSI|nr:unnamed protein product [Linum tenue]